MSAHPSKEQVDTWHPRNRADKQLIHFISKDNQKFAFDKAILSKERDMFSLDTGSTQKHRSTDDEEPIHLDANVDDVGVLFDILSAPLGRQSGLKLSEIAIKSCIALTALADTYSFCRIKSLVEASMIQHLEKRPIQVLEVASSLGLLGVEFGRKAMTHMMQERCDEDTWHGCTCGIQWKNFDGANRAWRAELALALLQTRSDSHEIVFEQGGGITQAIFCAHLRAAVELLNPEQPRSETIRYITN